MNDSNFIVHTIRPGDTLYNLALMYGTSVEEILNTNLALDPYSLRVGQQIYIYPRVSNLYNYWMSINPFYPREEIKHMLYEHLRLTTHEVSNR